MKKITRFIGAFLSVMLIASSGFADLSAVLDEGGVKAVSATVEARAAKIYESDDSDTAKQEAITALLDEAAATGNADVVRAAIFAVIQAGGAENLALSKSSISQSTVTTNFGSVAQSATTTAGQVYAGGGSNGGSGGSSVAGNGGGAGGGTSEDYTVFSNTETATEDDLGEGDINDNDTEATDT